MVRVINNNLWSPIPWGWGCGGHICGGGNWMQKMFGYQMLFNMFQNMGRCYMTPPQQQGGYSMGYNPYGVMGLQLGGGGGMPQTYEEALEQQTFNELKSAWSEFRITKVGDRYYAYLKSDRTQRIEADTVDELMDGLNTYVDENPDKFKSKPAAKVEAAEVDDDDTAVDPAGSANGSDGTGDAPGTDDNGTVQQGTQAGGDNGGNTRPYKKATLDEHHHWSSYNKLESKYKSRYSVGMTVDEVLYQTIPAARNWPEETRNQYIQYLRDVNPTAIDNDDKVTNLNKLDLILEDSAPATTTPEVIDKTKSRTLNITFAIHSLRGCYGDASVTTPDGVTHTVSTGVSWDNENARNDLGKKMVEKLKEAGWRNFTLKNSNFNFSISQYSGASGSW